MLADRWKETKPKDFANVNEYFNRVLLLDPGANVKMHGQVAVIMFSDGSEHAMNDKSDKPAK